MTNGNHLPTAQIVTFVLAENCLLREALVRILRNKEDIVIAGAISFSSSAVEQLSAARPDVIVFDSPNIALAGPRLVTRLRQSGSNRKCIMVGMEDDESTFLQAVAAGVVGYVLKDAAATEIVRVIRAVAAGEAVCPPRFSRSLFHYAAREVSLASNLSSNSLHKTKFGLTPREQQLVGLIHFGLSNKEIATRLHLSEQTVKNHVHRILQKVGVTGRLDISERLQPDPSERISLLVS